MGHTGVYACGKFTNPATPPMTRVHWNELRPSWNYSRPLSRKSCLCCEHNNRRPRGWLRDLADRNLAAADHFIASTAGEGVTPRIHVGNGQAIYAVPMNSQVFMRTGISQIPVQCGWSSSAIYVGSKCGSTTRGQQGN